MNKILNINLGGYALTIDDDAYEYLEAYLQSIRRRFSESEGRDEIVKDIESRLGELIAEGMGSRTIVMLPDVEAAVQVMGKPEDFGADPIDNKRSMGGSSKGSGSSIRTGKRLFRDEDDAIVGGVCSGLAAYFGMADPVWMRLIFVLLAFISMGFWAPAYILLWILVPAAKSAGDRLSMRGEPINVDNIAKEIEVGFDRLGNKVNELSSDAKKKSTSGGRSFGNAVAGGVSVLGRLFGFFIQFIAKFGVLIAILVIVGVFVALCVSWMAGIWSLVQGAPYMSFFSPYSAGWNYLGLANLFFVLGIPLLGLALMFIRALFKTRTPRWLGTGLTLFWVINLISAFAFAMFGFRGFSQGTTISKTLDLNGIGSDTLHVERLGDRSNIRIQGPFWGNWEFEGEGEFSENKISLPGDVSIRVRPSQNGQFRLIQNITARGYNLSDANQNAEQIGYAPVLQGNTLRVPLEYSLVKGQRWRAQRVRLILEMPPGKCVTFDNKIYHHAAADLDDYADDEGRNYISRTPGKVFQMTARGLACRDCPRFGDRDYEEERRYEDFILEGNFDTEIRRDDNFSIEIDGPAADKDLIKSVRSGDKLTLTTEDKTLVGKVKIIITTPVFTNLHVKNTGNVVIRGFEEGRSTISSRGTATIRGYFDSHEIKVSLSGKSTLDLTGEGDNLDVTLSEGATLDAGSFRVERVSISATDGSKARVYAEHEAISRPDGSSSVKVEGGAKVTSGGDEN